MKTRGLLFSVAFLLCVVSESMAQPNAPSALVATTTSTTAINLTWTDNATNETGFQIERSLTTGTGFTLINTTAANAVSYSNTGLTAGTKYFYRIRAINGGGNSAYTAEASATTQLVAPTALVATSVSTTGINLTWTDNSANETGYQIEQSLTTGTGFSTINTTSANAVSFSVTGLTAGTKYFFRIKAINANGASVYSAEANAVAQLIAPTAPSATSASTTSINLAWTDNSSNETGFTIERSLSTGTGFAVVTTTAANAVAYTNTGLTAGTKYYYRIKAVNSGGISAYTSEVNATTLLSTPTSLTATSVSTTGINLSWVDNSTNETGYQIEQSLTTGTGFSVINTTAANAVSYSVTGLTAGTKYFFRLKAINANGSSAYSAEANATAQLIAPTSPVATTVSASSISLTWVDNSSNETGFTIERSLSSGTGFAAVTTTAANVVSYSNASGLTAGTRYYYRIKAVNASGASAYTAEVNAVTMLSTPTALVGTAVSPSGINLTWTDNSTNETGYQLERSLTTGTGFSLVTTTASNVNSYSDTGLNSTVKYFYRLRAINAIGTSAYSSEASTTTLLVAPTSLVAVTASTTSVNLTWVDNSSNETGFKVERSLTSGSGYTVVATTAANATSYTNTGLTASTTYFYRVRAANATPTYSLYTSEMNANTGVPASPTGLASSSAGFTSIGLTWNDMSSGESGFSIERSLTTGTGFTVVGTAAANSISFTDNGLAHGQTYYYRVRAVNSIGNSAYTSEASYTTEAGQVPDIIEFNVLKTLYDSLNGAGWTSKNNWPTGSWPTTATSANFGTWEGVLVENGDITQLNFNGYHFSGHIPANIGNLGALQVLFLPNNSLTGRLPSSIGNLSNLRILHLSYNQFSGSIPREFGNLTSIQTLALGGAGLSGGIPTELGNLSALQTLLLSSNQLSGAIPSSLGNLSSLIELDLDGNVLTGSIPSNFSNLTALRVLHLESNHLSGNIPSTLGNMSSITNLYLHYNELSGTIPSSLGSLSQLLILMLSGNQLTGAVPAEIGNLSNLNYLYLNTNQLTSIPSSFSNLDNLLSCVLDANNLTSIPPALGGMQSLQMLSIGGNQLSGSIPSELGNLSQLQSLYLQGNHLSGAIPASLGNLSHLQNLYLSGNNLGGPLPSELGNLSALNIMSLEGNSITGNIPTSFGNLSQLQVMYLHYNQLSGTIPPQLGSLSQLQYLYLFGNKLSGTIPSELGNLSNVVILYLFANQLTGSIPASLGNMNHLQQIYLGSNNLTGSIPPELGDLTDLVVFDLSYNKLSGPIPTTLASLSQLQVMYLQNNQLSGHIPAEIGTMPNLQYLVLYGNKLSGSIPPELGNLSSLLLLDLGTNQLSGSIPASIGGMSSLRYMDLNSNHFTGSIPASIGTLNSLTYLNLAYNKLTSFPDLSGISNAASRQITVSYNSIPFGDFERYFSPGPSPFGYFDCIAQTEYLPLQINATLGNTLIITLLNPGAHTSVTWAKKNGENWEDVTSQNEDATQFTFKKSNVTEDIIGIYRAGFTNSLFPGVTLVSNATSVMTAEANATQQKLDNWAFQYRYDARKRMTHKKVPGADWVYMVYDDRDRLVMTQDGNQRLINQWSYTKYDALNRPIITGLYKHLGTERTQAEMAGLVSANVFFEHYDNAYSANHGYSDTVFPTGGDVLTVTYYDNYDFKELFGDTDYDYLTNELAGQEAAASSLVAGQVTGGKVRVIGYNFLQSVNYYDSKYRLIQAIGETHRGGRDRTTYIVDFTGKILASKTSHRGLEWKNVTGVEITSNSIRKTAGNGWTDGGASSVQVIPANTDGWLEVTVSETNTDRMIGFATTDPDAGYASINYALYLAPGLLTIYESGSDRNLNAALSTGDVLRIERIGTSIRYLRNNSVIYNSLSPTASALLIDVSLYTQGSTLTNIRSSLTTPVESIIARRFTYDHAGRLQKTFHQVDLTKENGNRRNECNDLWNDVVGLSISGNFVSSIAQTGWGNAGAVSTQKLPAGANGWLELTVSEVNSDRMIGFAYTSPDAGFTSIDYALYLSPNILTVYEKGSAKPVNESLTSGDILRIERTGTVVKYLRNGSVFYTSATPSSGAMLVDMSLFTRSSTIENIRTSFFVEGPCERTFQPVAGKEILLSMNEYNELGQLVAKKLHSTDAVTVPDSERTFKQTIDYRYNIRGWLTSINESDNLGQDYFGMKLGYNELIDTGNDALFNGNISGIRWSANLGLGTVKERAYNYTYDPMNRILTAAHKTKSSVWASSAAFSENNYKYDLNGNIQSLIRKGASGDNLDDLTYYYGAGLTRSNRLLSVSDNGDVDGGFIDAPHDTNDDYAYDANGNMVKDLNKKLEQPDAIRYNYLNLPDRVQNHDSDFIRYTYDAAGKKLRQELLNGSSVVQKKTDYVGDFVYENDVLQFVNTEEGRFVVQEGAPVYQYHLKDHLGNVRMTFTTKDEADTTVATMEPSRASSEQSQYLNYEEAVIVNADIFDHTHFVHPTDTTFYSARLAGGNDEVIGLAKSVSVMPGDKISVEVFAKYLDPNSNNWTVPLRNFMNSIMQGGGAPAGTVIDGAFPGSLGHNVFPFPGQLDRTGDTGTGPKAYLNYLVFSKSFVVLDHGFRRVSVDAKESGNGTLHQKLSFDGTETIPITEPGYVYIWLSNENDTPVEVFFDDFKVTQIKSPVVQTDDYYPFGLTFNSYSRENSVSNKFLYNQGLDGKKFLTERISDLGLNVDLTKFRVYDPAMGRWWQVDPKADKKKQEILSPYNYSFNNPIRYNDPNGDCPECIAALVAKYTALFASLKSSSEPIARLATNSSSLAPKNIPGGANNTPMENKTLGTINDAGTVAKNVAQNTKVVTNEVSKDGLAAAKAVGTGLDATGVGAPAGVIINTTAEVLDQTRQVAFEDKPVTDAAIDAGVNVTIDLTFTGLGNAAKSTVSGEGKEVVDKTIDAYSFSFSNLFQWVADKISGADDKKK